jgi:hypothetical protein
MKIKADSNIVDFPVVSQEIPEGGNEGDHLAKASNADGDVEWVQPETSDVDRAYVDAQGNLRVLKAGDVLTGRLRTSVSPPITPDELATKEYVDSTIGVSTGAQVLIAVMDATTGLCRFSAASGYPAGFLPDPGKVGEYVLVEVSGVTPPEAVPPDTTLVQGDWLVCDGVDWIRLNIGSSGAGIPEAPETPGVIYGRRGEDLSWQDVTPFGPWTLCVAGPQLTGPVFARWVGNPDNGSIQLRGSVSRTTGTLSNGDLLATTPAGLRSSVDRTLLGLCWGSGAGVGWGSFCLNVELLGRLTYSPPGITGARTVVYFDGVMYPMTNANLDFTE